MTPYLHDGTIFDLDRQYVDVTGVLWKWNGQHNEAGEPLMASHKDEPLVSLPDLYHDHGPLIPLPAPTPAGLYRQILTGGTAA